MCVGGDVVNKKESPIHELYMSTDPEGLSLFTVNTLSLLLLLPDHLPSPPTLLSPLSFTIFNLF